MVKMLRKESGEKAQTVWKGCYGFKSAPGKMDYLSFIKRIGIFKRNLVKSQKNHIRMNAYA
jgi:hypothetical protein